jgi:hypothetical protein
VIKPDGMADDLGRKPMPRIRGGLECHAVSLAHLPLKHQQRLIGQYLFNSSRLRRNPFLAVRRWSLCRASTNAIEALNAKLLSVQGDV